MAGAVPAPPAGRSPSTRPMSRKLAGLDLPPTASLDDPAQRSASPSPDRQGAQRAAADLAARRRGQGRPGRGGRPHRRLRRAAGRRRCRELPRPAGGVLTTRQTPHPRRPPGAGRRRLCGGGHLVVHRRAAAAARSAAAQAELVLANPIAAELDCMRPSILPNLIEAAGAQRQPRLRRRAPCSRSARCSPATEPAGPAHRHRRRPRAARRPSAGTARRPTTLFALKGDLMALLDELGAPVGSLQIAQGAAAPLVASGPLGAAAAGPKGGARRVRRAASGGARGAGRRRARSTASSSGWRPSPSPSARR